jgi:hypothetical protein
MGIVSVSQERSDPVKKLIPWLLAVIAFQAALQFYAGRYLSVLLAPAVSSFEVTNSGSDRYSYDGRFRADLSNEAVKIYTAGSNKPVKEIDLRPTEERTYFSWLQGRDIALVGISKTGTKGTICTLESLNMVTGSQPFQPTITGLSKDAEITGVACSTETNVIYIQVTSDTISDIYRSDANNILTRVGNTPPTIGRIASLSSEDALLYDSVNTGRVYLVDRKGKQWISPHDGYRYALIGTDQNDDIYIARLSGPDTHGSAMLADAIMVGKKERAFSLKEKLTPCSVDSIEVSNGGDVTHG